MTESSRTPTADQPHPDPEVWAPRLARILDLQITLYEQLAALAAEQSQFIDAEETDGLLDILGRREQLIEQIALTNQEVAPFVQSWERLAPTLPSRHRIVLRQRFDSVAAIVDQIAQRDEADRKRLEARRTRIGQEIEGLSNVRGAINAYTRPAVPGGGPIFQDSRG
ncbi:MAG: flagellar export chaperone FlgN [Phycisphaerae bacterium]|nr:flagellar export chaperone FlgN [Phycisphaerae bacterium]